MYALNIALAAVQDYGIKFVLVVEFWGSKKRSEAILSCKSEMERQSLPFLWVWIEPTLIGKLFWKYFQFHFASINQIAVQFHSHRIRLVDSFAHYKHARIISICFISTLKVTKLHAHYSFIVNISFLFCLRVYFLSSSNALLCHLMNEQNRDRLNIFVVHNNSTFTWVCGIFLFF